jgi:RND family efflux transporter MFP subunit
MLNFIRLKFFGNGWQTGAFALPIAVVLLSAVSITSRAADTLTINGITEPFLDVTLTVSVPGIIRSEPFTEGASVKKGQVVLELDKKLEEFEAAKRKAAMEEAKSVFESTQKVRENTKSVSDEELKKKETEYNVAAAEYGTATEELTRRQVVAPFDGTIAEIVLRTGAPCAPYQPIARLVDTSRFYFVGHLDGKSAQHLALDQPVTLNIDGADQPVTGKICFISPVVDPASGLSTVKAIFENPDGRIRPGLAAKLSVQ